MTNTNKILLKTLINIEVCFLQINSKLDNSLPLSIQLDFSRVYDLYSTIISAFNIPTQNYEKLYDILENLTIKNVDDIIFSIEDLII